jgi:DeoR/GlpR family transcriptional regulator of sugar metabolism
MLAQQRHARILTELEARESVRVSELVELLGVSDMTIRRDLDALHRAGQLLKVHGGATRRADRDTGRSTDEPGFAAKSGRETAEKEAIAARAAQLVEPGSAVAISAGTTTHALARHLVDVPELTVVTNSVWVADTLHASLRADTTILLTGGLRTPSDALVGPLTVNALRSIHADLVFMGVHGMDPRTGFTTPNLMESDTNKALVACARRLVVVADSTKWGVVGLSSFAALGDADVLVTDTGLGNEARDILGDAVAELVLVPPAQRRDGPVGPTPVARGDRQLR